MKCKMTLKDGTALSFTVNGNNLVSKQKTDETLLTELNLSEIYIEVDGQKALKYDNIVFVQQVLYNKEWYLALRQETEEERNVKRMRALEAKYFEIEDSYERGVNDAQ